MHSLDITDVMILQHDLEKLINPIYINNIESITVNYDIIPQPYPKRTSEQKSTNIISEQD